MRIINRSHIPYSLFRYLSQETYDVEEKGESISATEIIEPVQIAVLKRRYNKDIVVDAIDRLWIMLGNGVHKILEEEEGVEKIERLKVKVLGREFSGKFDRIFDGVVTDYKVTSAWTLVYGSRETEWVQQLSIYRWLYYKVKGILLNKHGHIVALLRDWSERNLSPNKKEDRYPTSPAVELQFSLMSTSETEKFVEERVKAITEAEELSDDELPKCTKEERWWSEKTKKYNRCLKYCEASSFCKQFKKDMGLGGK